MKYFITAISAYLAVVIIIAITVVHYFGRVESGQYEFVDTLQTLMLVYRFVIITLGVIVLCLSDWCCIRNHIGAGWTLIPFPIVAASVMADQWWFAWKWHELYRQINPGNNELFYGGFLSFFWLFIILLAAVINIWFLMTVMKYQNNQSAKSQ